MKLWAEKRYTARQFRGFQNTGKVEISHFCASQSLGIHDSRNRSNGFDDISSNVAHVVALDLDYQVVVAEEQIGVCDAIEASRSITHVGLRAGFDVDQNISDRHGGT